MHLYPLPRGRYFSERIEAGVDNPFDLRVHDFPVSGIYSDQQIQGLVEWLCMRFDAFRIKLQLSPGRSARAFDSETATGEVEIMQVNTTTGDVEAADRFLQAHQRSVNLLSGPAARFYYYRCPQEKNGILRILCSHLATDLVTAGVITQAIASFLVTGPLPMKGATYLEWMNRYGKYVQSLEGAAELAFWAAQPAALFEDARKLWRPTSTQAGKTVTLALSPRQMIALRGLINQRRPGRLIDVLVGIVLCALHTEFGMDDIPLSWTSHGRYPLNAASFSHTAGWLSNIHPLLVSTLRQTPLDIGDDFRRTLESLPHHGSAFNWIAHFAQNSEATDLESRLSSPFTINVRQGARPHIDGTHDLPGQSLQPKVSERVRPDWRSYARLYIAIEIGITLKINLTGLDDGPRPGVLNRMAASIEHHLGEF